MRNRLFLFAMFCMLPYAYSFAAIVNGTCGTNLTWSVNSKDSTITISGSGEMSWDGDTPPWNDYKQYIINVDIHEGVTNVKTKAFTQAKLNSVYIPNTITEIENHAFQGSCKTVTLNSDYITNNNNYNIYNHMGYKFGTVTEFIIGEDVTCIGSYTFYCNNLQSITIGSNVSSIGSHAFTQCSNLKTITIPQNVLSIDVEAFYKCYLDTVIINSNALLNIDYVPYSYYGETKCDNLFYALFTDNGSVKTLIIGDDVTKIGNYAFYDWKYHFLENLVIGSNVKTVGNYAFANNSSIKSIRLGNSVEVIGESAFENAKYYLDNIVIPNSVKNIQAAAFKSCEGLRTVSMGNALMAIEREAFNNCTSLISIDLPNSLIDVGEKAFYKCSSLVSVTMGSNVKKIGAEAFSSCSKLSSVVLGNNIDTIGTSAFSGCTVLTTVNISDIDAWCKIHFENMYSTPTFYSKKIFMNNELITDLQLSDQTTSIGNYAFYNCEDIKSVSANGNLTRIGTNSFKNCSVTRLSINADTPPTNGVNSGVVNTSCYLYVPAESIDTYANTIWWEDFLYIRALGITHTITFVDMDGTILATQTFDEGETIIPPTTPQHEGYTFIGWDTDLTNITSDITVTAQYTINRYRVQFLDWDGTILKMDSLEYLSNVVPPSNPTRNATAEFTYTFAGWNPEIIAVIGDATYTAIYSSTRNSYTITWMQDDGTTIDQTSVEYGQVPTHENANKERTAEFTYTFAGWTPEIVAVTSDATYTATYNSTINKYTITFKNEDGSVLCEDEWEYGTMPSCAEPTKEDDEQYTYTFSGWTPELAVVTEDAIYTATYDAMPIGEGIEDVNIDSITPQKVYHNGQIFILRGDKTYTITGAEVK